MTIEASTSVGRWTPTETRDIAIINVVAKKKYQNFTKNLFLFLIPHSNVATAIAILKDTWSEGKDLSGIWESIRFHAWWIYHSGRCLSAKYWINRFRPSDNIHEKNMNNATILSSILFFVIHLIYKNARNIGKINTKISAVYGIITLNVWWALIRSLSQIRVLYHRVGSVKWK